MMNFDTEELHRNRCRIGLGLKSIREQRGLSMRQLAEEAGVNYVNICKIENGKYNVSIDILYKVCKVLDADIQLISK